jgi:hypothetical protein
MSDVPAAARRAGLFMFILGGMLTVLGVCDVLQAVLVPIDKQLTSARQMQPQGGMVMSDGVMKAFILGMPILVLLLGLGYIGLAVGVRRGGKGSTILATILTSILLALLGLIELAALLASVQMPAILGVACLMLLPIGLMIPLIIWLISVLRATPQNMMAQQQYMAQYWHYQQQMHNSPAYGYAQPQPGQGYAPPAIPQQPSPPDAPPTDSPAPPPASE